jgi:2-amino-4-hydroxy-6-hydroxymethyldihydropteridine diphosphokinase
VEELCVILIGLGGNLESPRFGKPRDTQIAALAALGAAGVAIVKRSSWYQSEPVPRSNQPWYVNAVVSVATRLCARELLSLLQAVETQFGRVHEARNAARVLDLDLLNHGGEVIKTSSLVLPHPRLQQRRFVLVPLVEIAPDWRHPVTGLTAVQLLAQLKDEQDLKRLSS